MPRKPPTKPGRQGKDRYVQLEHYILNSDAWWELSGSAVKLFVELNKRYNGANNGSISLSTREAADILGSHKDTARKYLHELEELGFVEVSKRGVFRVKNRTATEYILCNKPYNDKRASKNFMHWSPEKNKTRA